jgi:ribose transport system ATP-binding protein
MSAPASHTVLSARSVSKTFSGKTVLRDLDLDVRPGEVHGLLGQNGSGKSTFIKILAGFHAPDDGASLEIAGRPVALPLDPSEPHLLGLSFVHQDLGLVPEMTVLENLRIRSFETGFGWRIRWRRERRRVREALDRFGLQHVSPRVEIASLRDVERALVAIVRALEQLKGHTGGLLVLDEPTAYLPRDGVDRLFHAVRTVAAAGHGVLFVTHRLEEVRALTDRVTILRDGAHVETADTASLTERDLIERILGRSLGELYPSAHHMRGDIALSVDGVAGSVVRSFSLQLRRGEIVGLTGLLGMGQEQVPHLLFGSQPATAGRVELGGRALDLARMSPRRAIAEGIALLPANRLREGAAQAATVTENVTLATLSAYFRRGLLNHRRERRDVAAKMREFQVVPPEPMRVFAKLSGGNQQKALLAKWFATRPRIFLLHEPTQGVDIGAKQQIFAQIRDVAEAGGAVIIASVEYEDLAHLCDRVLVFRDGEVVAELDGADLVEHRIVEQCFASERGPAAAARA